MNRSANHKRFFSRNQTFALLVGIVVMTLGFLVGRTVGTEVGTLVGKGIGSFNGITRFKDAIKEGEDDGLNSNDITVTLKQAFAEAGNLQVLSVDASCDNFQSDQFGSHAPSKRRKRK